MVITAGSMIQELGPGGNCLIPDVYEGSGLIFFINV